MLAVLPTFQRNLTSATQPREATFWEQAAFGEMPSQSHSRWAILE